jgi:hypothetical protein
MKTATLENIEGLEELTSEQAAQVNGGLSGWGIFGIVLGSVVGVAAVGVGIGIAYMNLNKNWLNIGGPW